MADLEGIEALERNFVEQDLFDARCGGSVLRKLQDEIVQIGCFSFGVDAYAVDAVQDPSVDKVMLRGPIDERTESDALDDAVDAYVKRLSHNPPLKARLRPSPCVTCARIRACGRAGAGVAGFPRVPGRTRLLRSLRH